MARFSNTERLGVNHVEEVFLKDFGWIPRTYFQSDIGIDMEVELSVNGKYTGQLIGVQIKSGESYFNETNLCNVIFRGSLEHLEYWLNHSLPIIIVLYNPTTQKAIWQKIDESTITRTKKKWKVEIPINQELSLDWKEDIERLNKYPIYFQRLQRLAVHKEWMQKIKEGEKIVVEVNEWVNKSSGRADIQVKMVDFFFNETILSEGSYLHFREVEDLKMLFPWADFSIDEDYYSDQIDEDYNNEGDFGMSLLEYKQSLPAIWAIPDGSGEIQTYRLELSLNFLGTSFLEVNNFLDFGLQLELPL